MSARQYSVVVKVKGDDTFRKLEQLQGGGAGGGRRGGSLAADGGFFKKLERLASNQLVQLGAIVTGIGGLTAIMTKASGHLQATFKLWETSMMLIFRPFGDFIGMVFRPFAIAMLGIAMPFYREGAKWFKTYGKQVGETLLSLSGVGRQQQVERTGEELGLAPDEETKRRAQEAYNKWVEFFESLTKRRPAEGEFGLDWGKQQSENILDQLESIFTNFGLNMQSRLLGIPPAISKLFFDFGANVWNHLVGIPQFLGGLFTTFGQNLWNSITGIPGMIGDVFNGLINGISNIISDILNRLSSLASAVTNNLGLPGSGGPTVEHRLPFGGTPVAPSIRRAQLRTQIAGIADTLE